MDSQTNTPQEDNNSIRDKHHQKSQDTPKDIVPPEVPIATDVPNSTSRSVLSWLTRLQNNIINNNDISNNSNGNNNNATSSDAVFQDDTIQTNGQMIQNEPHVLATSTDLLVASSGESPLPQASWYSYYTSFIFPSSGGESPAMEHMPLLQGNLSITKGNDDEDANNGTDGWFGWLFGSKKQTQEDEVSDESSEAYKSAKVVIESSKEECHYTYKSTNEFKTFEMSVDGTPTENLPVLIHTRKHKPVSAHEVYEKTLRVRNNNEAEVPVPGISPRFVDNYREITWKTKTRLLAGDLVCGYDTEHHLYRKKEELALRTGKLLKKIVVISVHNFLPVKLVRALIGEYTGNAIGYAKLATKAIKTWMKQNNPEYQEDEVDIISIALDGQGRASTSVDDALRLLRNYTKELNESDFIYVVGYGTSSPIAINLLAELLSQNHHLCRKRIGVLSMSGNLMGPVSSKFTKIVYRAYTQLENDIVREVFDYSKNDHPLSRKLTESIRFLVDQNVKFTLSSTTSDSFIPLYSSLGIQFDHPNIHRNLYHINTAPFISTVLDISCQMKNLGVFRDHEIIKILSDRLDINNTSRYIFDDEQVYLESLRFALESTKLHKLKPVSIRKQPRGSTMTSSASTSASTATASTTPSIINDLNLLLYNFRGFIQEFVNVKHVNNVTQLKKLLEEYKSWEPNLKTKDVKYCLEALDNFQIEELFI